MLGHDKYGKTEGQKSNGLIKQLKFYLIGFKKKELTYVAYDIIKGIL